MIAFDLGDKAQIYTVCQKRVNGYVSTEPLKMLWPVDAAHCDLQKFSNVQYEPGAHSFGYSPFESATGPRMTLRDQFSQS